LVFLKSDLTFLENGVLEIKGGIDELPLTLARLISLNCIQASFSKYEKCIERLRAIHPVIH
jgi:hypothetical protein